MIEKITKSEEDKKKEALKKRKVTRIMKTKRKQRGEDSKNEKVLSSWEWDEPPLSQEGNRSLSRYKVMQIHRCERIYLHFEALNEVE